MGQSIGIESVSGISILKCIGIGLVVKKWYQCITSYYNYQSFNPCKNNISAPIKVKVASYRNSETADIWSNVYTTDCN